MVRASAKTGEGLETIRRELVRLSPGESLHEAQLVADLLSREGSRHPRRPHRFRRAEGPAHFAASANHPGCP